MATDPHRPYTLWFVNTSGDGKLRFVIWPRKGIAHTVLKGDEQRWLGDFDTVEEAEEWGYRLFGKLFLNVPLLSGHDIQVMRQVPGRC